MADRDVDDDDDSDDSGVGDGARVEKVTYVCSSVARDAKGTAFGSAFGLRPATTWTSEKLIRPC